MSTDIIPATIKPESLTVIVDTREQNPYNVAPLRTTPGTLCTGDYSIVGLEHVVRIERKSLPDLLACVGRERERFDREVQRLLSFPVRVLVVEATWNQIEMGEWRSQIKPSQAMGSLLGWIASGLPIVMADSHERGGQFTSRILYTTARRRWREANLLVRAVESAIEAEVS